MAFFSALIATTAWASGVCDTTVVGTMNVGTNLSLGKLCMGAGSQLRIADATAGNPVHLTATDSELSAGGTINHWYAQHPGTKLDLYGNTSVSLPGTSDVFTIRSSTFDTRGMDVINHGTVQQTGAGMLNFSGTANLLNETGAYYNLSGGTGMRVSNSLLNKGTFTTSDGAVSGGGSLKNDASGTFVGNLSPGASGERLGVSNSGTFEVSTGQSARVASFTNHAGSLVVNGEMENVGGQLSLLGGTLSGAGIINADLFVGGGPGTAFFNPGNSPGTMTINGNFTLQPGGVLNLEVVPDGSGGFLFDTLNVSGSVFLDGQVNFLVDPAIGEGAGLSGIRFFDSMGFVDYGFNFIWNIPGRPGSQLNFLDDGTGFSIDYLAPSDVAPVPVPAAVWLLGSGLVALAGVRAKRRR